MHASSRTQELAWPHAHVRGLWCSRVEWDHKKGAQLAPLRTPLLAPDREDPTSTPKELDVRWSCVLKKAHDSWMWMALCPKSRPVVAYAVGARSRQDVSAAVGGRCRGISCWSLRNGFLGGVQGGDPMPEHQMAGGKETGETAQVERWKNTLRKPLARFVCMPLSFSKSEVMHEACLLLFLHRSHLDRALLLK